MNTQSTLHRAFAAHQAGNLSEAEFLYKLVLSTNKKHFDALHMLGVIEAQRGSHNEALRRITEALRVQPNSADAYINLGRTYAELSDYSHAIESYKKALRLTPRSALAHNNLSIILRRLRRGQEALVHCDKALEIEPTYADAWNNRGNVLFDLDLPSEALASYDRALALNPVLAESFLGRANALNEMKRADEALAAYDKALTFSPHLAEAWFGRGLVLGVFRRFEEAFVAFDKAFAIKPDLEFTEGARIRTKMQICDWRNLDAECSHLLLAIRNQKLASGPFAFLSIPGSSADQLECAKLTVASRYPTSPQPLWQKEQYKHERIRVAYLSADFRDHPVSHLLAGLFSHHDRARFETIAISFGSDIPSPMRARLKGSFERFIDVQGQSDSEVARLLRELEIDIAVDLMGHTDHSSLAVFAFRPAPIQVSYLGYAGTTGADYIDYILADRFVIPEDQRQFYSEKSVYLPDTFMAADSKRAIAERTPSRTEQGLPEAGFVFCSFNQSFKITPPVFAMWMRLLREVKDSVLWMSGLNDTAANNLRREATAREVKADRIIFAPRVEKNEDHLARHRLADLFLDTQPYNAHTSAIDALWTGLPLVTCLGSTFAGRVTGSLLHAVGLPELITQSLEEYEELALKLAQNPSLLASLKDKLARNRNSYPLFNTKRFTRHIEAAYTTMWNLYKKRETPQDFAVDPINLGSGIII